MCPASSVSQHSVDTGRWIEGVQSVTHGWCCVEIVQQTARFCGHVWVPGSRSFGNRWSRCLKASCKDNAESILDPFVLLLVLWFQFICRPNGFMKTIMCRLISYGNTLIPSLQSQKWQFRERTLIHPWHKLNCLATYRWWWFLRWKPAVVCPQGGGCCQRWVLFKYMFRGDISVSAEPDLFPWFPGVIWRLTLPLHHTGSVTRSHRAKAPSALQDFLKAVLVKYLQAFSGFMKPRWDSWCGAHSGGTSLHGSVRV